MRRRPRIALLAGAALLCACSGAEPEEARSNASELSAEATFTGSAACADCHQHENELWRGSHHDLAMQEATELTVLGNFDGADLQHFGVTSRFSRRDGRFLVETEGPDGQRAEYEVAYVFGVTPLQQYLVEFPGGRLQTLPTCWDTRPAEAGGLRWYHIYPDEAIPAGDELHWTGVNQNWNHMCAACHSTGLRKGFDLAQDRYDTRWSELDVACEACHGPGSRHVAWARAGADPQRGPMLEISLRDHGAGQWVIDPETGNARRSAPRSSRAQSETCARCHSRRSVMRETPVDGSAFDDNYRLALLEEGLYHADGQILDEVYVHGSFLQSKMHREGVTCSDCHDPHSGRLILQDNLLCSRCHDPGKYDSSDHHHHAESSSGSACVDCHMPLRHYMVVDGRRDHSLRVPRPDLSIELGTPNACNDCHQDQDAAWAAGQLSEWFPAGRGGTPHYGQALHAGRSGAAQAGPMLAALARDDQAPGIARATALSLIAPFLSAETFPAVVESLSDADPLVRAAAADALEVLPPPERANMAFALLDDPVRLVRIAAARALGPLMAQELPDVVRVRVQERLDELRASELESSERASAHLNLGVLELQAGRLAEARTEFETALRLEPGFLMAHVNLADLHREQGDEEAAEKILRTGLEQDPNAPALHHALGLLLARTGRIHDALESLAQAYGLAPEEARFAYAHALALDGVGDRPGAMGALADAHRRHPGDRDILMALAAMHRDAGQQEQALHYAETLLGLFPGDPAAQQLVQELSGER